MHKRAYLAGNHGYDDFTWLERSPVGERKDAVHHFGDIDPIEGQSVHLCE